MKRLDYMSKYQWKDVVLYHGYKAEIIGHLQPGQYMLQYVADGNIVSGVYESELHSVSKEEK